MLTRKHRRCGQGRSGLQPSGLWGPRPPASGGRSRAVIAALIALLAVAVPLVASASGGWTAQSAGTSYMAPELIQAAAQTPSANVPVIVTSTDGTAAAARVVSDAFGTAKVVSPSGRLDFVDGVAVRMPADRLDEVAAHPGVTVTPDAPMIGDAVPLTKETSKTYRDPGPNWLNSCGCDQLVRRYRGVQPAAIAIVDSGIDQSRPDFAGRIAASVDLASLGPNSPGDGYGHGTFVAGIAAGGAREHPGVAPTAPLVSLDVMNDQGVARTSDVIRAAQWIVANKQRYGIGVANFSLHAGGPSSFRYDPLDKAIEKLWFSGVVVVTSAGNYGLATGASGVPTAPANDPFALTVGALDPKGSPRNVGDLAPWWSAYGYTPDGFAKPELGAPGRNLIGPVPPGSTLAIERPNQLVAPDYIKLSGTSFSAAVVTGIAAYVRGIHPDWTPDQVKGALMANANTVPKSPPLSAGLGAVDAKGAAGDRSPPTANLALDRFVVTGQGDSVPTFDAAAWLAAAKADPNWDADAWTAGGWSRNQNKAAVSWSDVSWSDVSWSDVSWSDVSWSDVSWSDVAWSDSGLEDAALGDVD